MLSRDREGTTVVACPSISLRRESPNCGLVKIEELLGDRLLDQYHQRKSDKSVPDWWPQEEKCNTHPKTAIKVVEWFPAPNYRQYSMLTGFPEEELIEGLTVA